jgi:hypothetical protein
MVHDNSGAAINAPKYQVEYYDTGAQARMACHFGSIHLKEYMAHAVQNQFAPGSDHDDIPYRLAELIVAKEIPRLGGNASFIIALCDASLMTYNPADFFFLTLDRIKSAPNWVPEDADSVYAFAFSGLQASRNGKLDTFNSLFEETAKSAIREFRDALKADIFRNNVIWFEELITEAKNLRINHRGFFTQLLKSPGVFSPMFRQIVSALGIPFTTNARSKGYFVPPEKLKALAIQPYYPKVFQAISYTFSGRRDCSLHPFCEASEGIKITNDDCGSSPWARVHLPHLCPYAQMWKTWGLGDKIPLPPGSPEN